MDNKIERVYGLRESLPAGREIKPSGNLLDVILKHPDVKPEWIKAIYAGSKHDNCSCKQCGGVNEECRVSYWVYVNATSNVQSVIKKILEDCNKWDKVTDKDVGSTESVIRCIKGEQPHGDDELFTEYAVFNCSGQ